MTCLMAFPMISYAQSQIEDVRISKPSIDKDQEVVTVRFKAEIGKKAVKRNYSLVFGPELTDGTHRWSLPVIIVQGRGSKVILERQVFASGREAMYDNALLTKNGGVVEYTASAPYQEWMEGATLSIEAIKAGCCSSSALVSETLAENLKLQPGAAIQPQPQPEAATQIVYVPEKLSTGDKLTQSYTFVTPVEKLEELERQGLFFNEDRENAITVHYLQSRYDIRRDYGNNQQSLTDMMASIRILENSIDSEVAAVLIAGFASPEGGYQINDRLAWNRAVSVKEYILQNSGLKADQIIIHNGSEDWQGLRMLAEASDMPHKAAVLDIIDNVPIWDARKNVGRLGELMRLENGAPYRYMLENFFPKLRNSAYIRVYYRNK